MNEPPGAAMDMSRKIFALGVGPEPTNERACAAIEHVFRSMRAVLVDLIGDAAFQAVMGRAARLAAPDFGWLTDMVAPEKSPTPTKDLPAIVVREGTAAAVEGGIRLLAQIFALLTRFIGDDLTWRLAHRAWPQLGATETSAATSEEGR
jgi:hypothetical protein